MAEALSMLNTLLAKEFGEGVQDELLKPRGRASKKTLDARVAMVHIMDLLWGEEGTDWLLCTFQQLDRRWVKDKRQRYSETDVKSVANKVVEHASAIYTNRVIADLEKVCGA